jgi:hypothetical protein
MKDAEDLKDCWDTLREVAVERAGRNSTVSMAVAIERINSSLRSFRRITHNFGTNNQGVTFVQDGEGEWAVILVDVPESLDFDNEPDFRPEITEALGVLFIRIHDAFLKYLLQLREEASQLKEQASKIDYDSFEVERLRQALGGYEPEQYLLPFPPTGAGVNVRTYVDKVTIACEDVVPLPENPDQSTIEDFQAAAFEMAVRKRKEREMETELETFDDIEDDIPF